MTRWDTQGRVVNITVLVLLFPLSGRCIPTMRPLVNIFLLNGHIWRSEVQPPVHAQVTAAFPVDVRGVLSDRFVVAIGVLGHEELGAFVLAALTPWAVGSGRWLPCVEVEGCSCIVRASNGWCVWHSGPTPGEDEG